MFEDGRQPGRGAAECVLAGEQRFCAEQRQLPELRLPRRRMNSPSGSGSELGIRGIVLATRGVRLALC